MNCPYCKATNISAGHIMGHAKSEAKTAAARANAKLPRKSIPLDERSPHTRALKEAGEIVRAGNPDATKNPSTDLQPTIQPDEYSQEMLSYE